VDDLKMKPATACPSGQEISALPSLLWADQADPSTHQRPVKQTQIASTQTKRIFEFRSQKTKEQENKKKI